MATAQDDVTGDGTTSNVLIIGELLKQADVFISEVSHPGFIWNGKFIAVVFITCWFCISYLFGIAQGLHPRLIAEGFDLAKAKALEVLNNMMINQVPDRDTLINVARTSLRTKLHQDLADAVTEVFALQLLL